MKTACIIFINFIVSLGLLLSFVYEYSKDHEKIINRISILESRFYQFDELQQNQEYRMGIFHNINKIDEKRHDNYFFLFNDLDSRLQKIESKL